MTKINPDPRDYRFTKKGNLYTKTDLASRIGAATGSAIAAAAIFKNEFELRKEPIGTYNLFKEFQKKPIKEVLENILKNYSEKAAKLQENPVQYNAKTANKLLNFYNKATQNTSVWLELIEENKNFYNTINKTPIRRGLAVLIPATLCVWALQLGGALVGKLIGKGIDAVDNKIAANRADRMAETKEAE